MKEVVKTLKFNENSAPTYLIANHVSFGRYDSALTQENDNKNPGYATFNAAAMSELFPKPNIHPFKMDSIMVSQVGSGNIRIYLMNDNSIIDEIYSNHLVNHTFEKLNIQTKVVKNLTRASNLKYKLVPKARLSVGRLVRSEVRTYFYQYDCKANVSAGSAGVQVKVSDSQPYAGETVTFTATVDSSSAWEGWYSDPECTQLVTKELIYSVPAADITLYAKASSMFKSSFYLKENNSWKKYNKVYQKENDSWKELSFEEFKGIILNNNTANL